MRTILSAGTASALLAFDCGLVVTAAEAQAVANLPLTCSSASAIGQPQNNCNGNWAYQLPNEQLVVLKGPSSSPTWALAANLAGTDTLAVCSLPVEPGAYSSCKDASLVRRIGYMAKSQVFGSSTPPLPPSSGAGARVLDLSAPVSITEPGRYVLDRDWDTSGLGLAPSDSLLVISADNVTLDMQGFGVSGTSRLLWITGNSATVQNGRLSATTGLAIAGGGSRSLIDAVQITGGLDLFGGGVVLTNSNISGTMMVERGVIVRNNLITSGAGTPWAVRVSEGAYVVDNQLRCGGTTCVTIDRSNSVVSRNVISSRGTAIKVEGGGNQVFDNMVLVNTIGWVADIHPEPVYIYLSGDVAIDVLDGGNTLRGNYVEPFPIGYVDDLETFNPWRVGLRFAASGNLYGDNVIGAEVPFDLGATVQRDLGGNQPLPVN